MLRGLVVPPDLANSAFQTLQRQINAKTKKYFADKGVVTDEREDDDNDAQLRATDQVFAIAGLYAPKAQAQAPALGFALEIDPSTGVVRLVAGKQPESVPISPLHNDYYQQSGGISPQDQAVTQPVKTARSARSRPKSLPSARRRVGVGTSGQAGIVARASGSSTNAAPGNEGHGVPPKRPRGRPRKAIPSTAVHETGVNAPTAPRSQSEASGSTTRRQGIPEAATGSQNGG